MPSFKVPCPSCEAPVLIKDAKLIGAKVECPKCKYRFKVEEPKAAPGEAKKDDKAKKPEAEKKKAAKGGKNKKLVPILVGVGAVLLLVGVGYAVFGGGPAKKKSSPSGITAVGGGGSNEDPDKKEPGAGGPAQPPAIPRSDKNIANLLPGQTVAAYRFNMDRVRENPVYPTVALDPMVSSMFENSMGFSINDVETYIHCFAGDARAPFGVIKLKNPTPEAVAAARMGRQLDPTPKAVKGRNLYAIKNSLLVKAVSSSLSMPSLLGEFYERVPTAAPSDGNDRPMGVCAYDTQHVLIGDYALLDRFLSELGADGYPPFQTALIKVPTAPVEAPPMPPAGDGTMPDAPPAPPKPKEPVAPKPPAVNPADGRALSSRDAYLTLSPDLKKVLDEMELGVATPMFVFAEKFDIREYDPKLLKKEYDVLANVLKPIAERTRYVGANVLNFTGRDLVANLRITLGTIDDSRQVAKEQLSPELAKVCDLLTFALLTPVEFRDYTAGGSTTTPGTGIPTLPGMGGFPFPAEEFRPEDPDRQPGRPGRPGGAGFPMRPPGGIPGGFPGGIPGDFPGGIPGVPGQFDPNNPNNPNPNDPNNPNFPQQPRSHIDLGMVDNQLLVAVELNWTDAVFRTIISPRVMSLASQVKGKMAIFSSEFSWHAVAAAGPAMAAEAKSFPRGTVPRPGDLSRFGFEYAPVTRVSLFYDLLPYLGRGDLQRRINPREAWNALEYEKPDPMWPYRAPAVKVDNLTPASQWVPELLVPYYPQSAWRATSPLAPEHTLGATNYVAVAGVGVDIARVNPNDEPYKKKVGITGYGWGSKPDEVTDGLSNTLYMLQTPPNGLQQPWIAGGGATVRGLTERDPMAAYKGTHLDGAIGTKQGTFALMGDGSVRWIPADIDPKVLHALATRAGGDNAALGDIEKIAPKVEPPKAKAEPMPERKPEEKKPEEKKPEDKKPGEKKEPGAGGDVAPAPREKKE